MRSDERHALKRLIAERGLTAADVARLAADGGIPGMPPFEVTREEIDELDQEAQQSVPGVTAKTQLELFSMRTLALLEHEVERLSSAGDRGDQADPESIGTLVDAIRELTHVAPLIRDAGAVIDNQFGLAPPLPRPDPGGRRRFERRTTDLRAASDSLADLRRALQASGPDPDAWQMG